MKNLNEDLKTGNIKQAYLLYGEEAYLKKQYRDRLTKAVLPEGDTVNYAHYEGKGINVPEIIDLAETMPFFAEKRLIVVEDSGLFKNSDAKFADYIKSMPETVCFVFVESEVDKRSKMYKAVKDTGRVVELGRQDEKTLLLWLAGNIKREGRLSSPLQNTCCPELEPTWRIWSGRWKSCFLIRLEEMRLRWRILMQSVRRRSRIRYLI